jgi:FdhE protein
MSTHPIATDVERQIQRLAAEMTAKRPSLEGLIRPFAGLLMEKARIMAVLKADLDPNWLNLSQKPCEAGLPILASFPCDFLKPSLNHAFFALLPVLAASFPAIAPDLARIETAQRNSSLEFSELAVRYFEGELEGFPETPAIRQIDRHSLAFAVTQVLSAVLRSLTPMVADGIIQLPWNRGYCPICGSLPSISYLSKALNASSEYLVGGGGQRYLHCAMCGHDWRVARHFCAACERDDNDEHLYFKVSDSASERVDVCHHCGHYLPCFDLRETDSLPHMDMLAVGLAHLDMLAQEKGFKPMVPAPWNTFE